MSKRLSDIYALIGYVIFFLLAWLIASPVLLLLRYLTVLVDRAHFAGLVSMTLKGLCYTLMIAGLMAATLVALVISLSAAQKREQRKQGTSAPKTPPL